MEKKIGSCPFFSPLRYRIRVLIFVSRIRSRRWHRPSLIPQGWHYYCLIGCVTRTTHFFPRNYYFHRALLWEALVKKAEGSCLLTSTMIHTMYTSFLLASASTFYGAVRLTYDTRYLFSKWFRNWGRLEIIVCSRTTRRSISFEFELI